MLQNGFGLENCVLQEVGKEAAHIGKRTMKVWWKPGVLIDVSKHYMQIAGRHCNMGQGPLMDGFIRFKWATCQKIRTDSLERGTH